MSQGHKLPYQQVLIRARRIMAYLRPFCEQIEIVGSLRRQKAQVGDIELLLIPRRQPDLFGNPGASLVDMGLNNLCQAGRLIPASKNAGDLLKRYYIPHLHEQGLEFKLEINISTSERWPIELAIKTGPAAFSHKLVTPRAAGGWLPGNCQIKDGWKFYQEGRLHSFISEREFIEFCCGRWIPPEQRGDKT